MLAGRQKACGPCRQQTWGQCSTSCTPWQAGHLRRWSCRTRCWRLLLDSPSSGCSAHSSQPRCQAAQARLPPPPGSSCCHVLVAACQAARETEGAPELSPGPACCAEEGGVSLQLTHSAGLVLRFLPFSPPKNGWSFPRQALLQDLRLLQHHASFLC